VTPIDSAPEQIKKIQERRRRRRKPFVEPRVPTFVMVSPGRYIRAEESTPSPVAPTGEAEEDNLALRTLERTEQTAIPASASIPEAGNGPANCELGSPGSPSVDLAGDGGIEVSLANEPSSDEETERGSTEEHWAGGRCA
jgi:hypothetical protein